MLDINDILNMKLKPGCTDEAMYKLIQKLCTENECFKRCITDLIDTFLKAMDIKIDDQDAKIATINREIAVHFNYDDTAEELQIT